MPEFRIPDIGPALREAYMPRGEMAVAGAAAQAGERISGAFADVAKMRAEMRIKESLAAGERERKEPAAREKAKQEVRDRWGRYAEREAAAIQSQIAALQKQIPPPDPKSELMVKLKNSLDGFRELAGDIRAGLPRGDEWIVKRTGKDPEHMELLFPGRLGREREEAEEAAQEAERVAAQQQEQAAQREAELERQRQEQEAQQQARLEQESRVRAAQAWESIESIREAERAGVLGRPQGVSEVAGEPRGAFGEVAGVRARRREPRGERTPTPGYLGVFGPPPPGYH